MNAFKTMAVVNPRSSNGKTGKGWPDFSKELARRVGAVDFRLTTFPGEATILTREALAKGYDLILSVGGDGTHHEVLNGFFDGTTQINPQAALAVITSGTGGDFRRTLGLEPGPHAALKLLDGEALRPIDVGRFSYFTHDGKPATAHFLNILSFGIGGLVDHYVNTTTKALGGRVSFFMGTLRAMMKYRPQPVRISLDGGPAMERTIHVCAVANGRYFGGGMFIAPQAELDDGQFEVVLLKDLSTARFVTMSSHIYSGTHVQHPNVEVHRASVIEASPVVPGDAVLLDVDGEAKGALPIKVEVLSKCLKLKVW